ncbi:MAG: restriction endonuclease subunit S [Chromatiaceae bacterium]|nr:restriction endonuclease subunit S [Chromatiaceae bacterium]
MRSLPIGSFCKTGSGGTPSRSKINDYYQGGDIPWIKSGELAQDTISSAEESITKKAVAESSAKLLVPGAILVAMYGATVGQVSRLRIAAATNQAICHIYPDTEVCEPDYLYRVLKGAKDRLLAKRVGGGQPNISQTIIRDLNIPLPTLAEQKRIAAILDAADALRSKRRESLAQLDTLLQSTFLDLFGDPVTNPKGWKMGRLADVVGRLDGGKNVAQSETETDYRVLKVSAVTSGIYRPEESKYLPADFPVPASYLVKSGDLLISRANTVELIGATAYVWKTPENIALPDKIWRFVWKENVQIEPLFIYHLSQNPEFRRILGSRASGTSGSMKNIAKPKLLSLPIPLPSFDLQRHFATIVESIEQQKTRLRAHLAELDTLFASLQSRAFNGQL